VAGPQLPGTSGRARPFTVGVLSQLLAGAYFGSLLQGAVAGARAEGGRVIGFQTRDTGLHEDDYRPSDYRSRLAWDYVDGFVVVVHGVDLAYCEAIKQAGKPVVFISPTEPSVPGPSIAPDNRLGTYNAVRHLVGHGHRRIAFVGLMEQEDIRQRYAGYLDALADCGIEADPSLLYPTDSNMEPSGRRAARAMTSAGLPSTAVVAGCDYNAIGVMEQLKAEGYSLPRQQAVVGFDDLASAPHTVPSLTSVRQPLEEMGRLAAELVARQLRGEEVPALRHVVPTELVCRESCGCWAVPAPPQTRQAPAGAGERGQLSPAQRLVADLSSELAAPGSGEQAERQVGQAASALAACLEAGPPSEGPAGAEALRRALSELYEARPRVQTVWSTITCLQRYRDDLVREGLPTDRLDQQWATITQVLAHLPAVAQSAINRRLQATMYNEYRLTVALLRENGQDPRALRWLEPTAVSAACLGLWSQSPNRLQVVGTFGRSEHLALTATDLDEPAFPPLQLLDAADAAGQVTHVLPVRGNGKAWGALALTSPVEATGTTGMDVFYQWTGLLAAALDRDEMLASLKAQAEELAQAVQRQHELVGDLRRSEERYSLAARAASDGLWDYDVATGTVYYSSRWKQVLGYRDDEVGSTLGEWLGRAHPDDRPTLEAAIRALERGATATMEVEHRLLAASGSYLWAHCRALAVPGGGHPARRVVGSLTDITRRRELEERLRQRALYDSLTGLPNRWLFLESLEAAQPAGMHERGALLFVDLDNFKNVNDTLGHDAGDELLGVIAKRVSASLRPEDLVARFGGDEFVAFARGVPPAEAAEIADRLRAAVRQPVDLGPAQVQVGCSIGIAMSRGQGTAHLLQQADAALYRAKAAGRDRCEIYQAGMQAQLQRRADMEELLRTTVAEGSLVVLYEPVVKLATGQAVGSEAVARVRGANGELLAPDQFMEVAAASGLVVPFGTALVGRACAQQASWASSGTGPRYVCVRLSPRQLADRSLVPSVAQALADSCLEAHRLRLELAETALVDAGALANRALEDLRALGVGVTLADFGTGRSGLLQLRRYPVDALKLDGSLVAALGTDEAETRVLGALVELAHALGLEVTASGVRHPRQAELLRLTGCDCAQGPLYGKPAPAGDWPAAAPAAPSW